MERVRAGHEKGNLAGEKVGEDPGEHAPQRGSRSRYRSLWMAITVHDRHTCMQSEGGERLEDRVCLPLLQSNFELMLRLCVVDVAFATLIGSFSDWYLISPSAVDRA